MTFLERALELAGAAGRRAYPNPTVGAVVVAGDEIVGEGATEHYGGRHGEIVALDGAGVRARGATLYVTMEPCTHQGKTPPCVDRVLSDGVARVVAGSLDPNPAATGGLEYLRARGVEVEHADVPEARRQNEAWRTWVVRGRPFVTYKAAITLDGRMTLPGERFITGPESRQLVHELRAGSDAVAVGAGTARADRPRLDARDVETPRGQPRRLVFGSSLPTGLGHELRSGTLADELAALGADGVQSLLLEGGPTLATAFLEADAIDKLAVFVAPALAGTGPHLLAALPSTRTLSPIAARRIGDDVLLETYVHEP